MSDEREALARVEEIRKQYPVPIPDGVFSYSVYETHVRTMISEYDAMRARAESAERALDELRIDLRHQCEANNRNWNYRSELEAALTTARLERDAQKTRAVLLSAGWKKTNEMLEQAFKALREIGERAVVDWQDELVGLVSVGLGTADWDSVVTMEHHAVKAARYERDEARLEHAQLVGEWERYREALIGAQAALLAARTQISPSRPEWKGCTAAYEQIDAALTPPSPGKG